MPNEHPDIATQLLRGQHRQTWAMILLNLVVAAAIGYIWVTLNSTQSALCTLRGDLVQRVQASEDFLAHHPNGIPGITAAEIRTQIANELRTITALNNLQC